MDNSRTPSVKPSVQHMEQRISELKRVLQQASYDYHVLDAPTLEDAVYDRLYRELQDLETQAPHLTTPDSPTQRVGERPATQFESVQHHIPLYSLENAFNEQELTDWQERWQRQFTAVSDRPLPDSVQYVAELKIDGSAIALTYENGILVRGATRGDGTTGEEITQNIKTIRSIPLRLNLDALNLDQPPFRIEIRGEAFLPLDIFETINQDREKAGDAKFANPRNAAAGTLRQLDSRIVAQRRLDFFAYTLQIPESSVIKQSEGLGTSPSSSAQNLSVGWPPQSQWGSLKLLQEMGFRVNPNRQLCPSLAGVQAYYDAWSTRRFDLPYLTDGVVVKLDSFPLQQQLGFTQKFPRWAIALKYPAEEVPTQIEQVTIQVGRTGALTPVAEFQPVQLAGTTVSRATLHNSDRIAELDLHLGDTVIVRKAGEIIPEVVQILPDLRPQGAQRVTMPTHCPECGEPVVQPEGEAVTRCINASCPAVVKGALIHWASRSALDIHGVGQKWVEQWVTQKLVTSVADLYDLTVETLLPLERMGQQLAQKLVDAISESKIQPWARVLYGLGIRHVGSVNAQLLTDHFPTVKALACATPEAMEQVHGIGPEIAQSVHQWFQVPANQGLIDRLQQAGVKLAGDSPESGTAKTQPLAGQTFVITGTLPTLSREQAKQLIQGAGGKVTGSVSKKTTYLVAGADAGSKLKKAQDLDIPQLSEPELMNLIQQTDGS